MANTDFGPCCYCGCRGTSVRNLLMHSFEGPPGFQGWSCLVCGQPPRGALSIMCDSCMAQKLFPKFIMGGKYAPDGVRIPLDSYRRIPFDHDMSKHPDEQEQQQ